MQRSHIAAAVALLFLPLGLIAQTKPDVSHFAEGSQRSFALVVQSSVVTMSGGWHPIAELSRYVQHHAGTYIVFTQDRELRRLDNPDRIAEARRIYAPMRELAIKQSALDAAQKPLDKEQEALGAQQRAARDPSEMGRIGSAQGTVGAEQGDLGSLQGAIGRQQGEVGRNFYNHVQTMLDACVADRTCQPVTDETAQR